MDTASGKSGTARKDFTRMLDDCKAHKIEIILTKNISPFGRDINVIIRIPNSVHIIFRSSAYRDSFCYNHFGMIIMTEIIISSVNSITDLAIFSELYKKGNLKLNVSKLAIELNKDRKTVQNYLNGKVNSATRARVKYLD